LIDLSVSLVGVLLVLPAALALAERGVHLGSVLEAASQVGARVPRPRRPKAKRAAAAGAAGAGPRRVA
jgi:hypothetical protein